MYFDFRSRIAVPVVALVVAIAGCNPEAGTPAAAAVNKEQTACALLTPDEIEASFNGAIQVVVDYGTDRLCDYRVVGHEGQMLLQRMDARTYNDRKAMYSSGAYGDLDPVAVAGLGQDAYLMGDTQIEVHVGEQQAFNLGLTLLTMGELPFTPEQSKSSMVKLAGTVANRL